MKANGVQRGRKRLKQLRGKLRQKEKDGPYYYRLMVADGVRKEFSLKTSDFEEACRKAADLDAVWEAPTKEIAVARIKAIKGFSKIAENLPLSGIWAKYEVHPDRARPLTPHESLMYRSFLQEFIDYAEGRSGNEKGQRRALSVISDITPEVVSKLEDTCGAGGLKSLLDEAGREFENFSARRTAAANAAPANDWRREDDSVPASEAALKALRAAAMNDGRNVESVCRGYGVDPDRISKHDCWRMTQDLNKRTGYGNA